MLLFWLFWFSFWLIFITFFSNAWSGIVLQQGLGTFWRHFKSKQDFFGKFVSLVHKTFEVISISFLWLHWPSLGSWIHIWHRLSKITCAVFTSYDLWFILWKCDLCEANIWREGCCLRKIFRGIRKKVIWQKSVICELLQCDWLKFWTFNEKVRNLGKLFDFESKQKFVDSLEFSRCF